MKKLIKLCPNCLRLATEYGNGWLIRWSNCTCEFTDEE